MDHLKPEHVALLTELARCQIAAHEALRVSAEPRSEAAANFAAQTERATQDMLRRALALGDRSPVTDPLREMARRMGLTLDESTANWRALAFEALRVMLDVSRERERREVGTYERVTPIFRSVMASRSASPAAALPVAAFGSPAPPLGTPGSSRVGRDLHHRTSHDGGFHAKAENRGCCPSSGAGRHCRRPGRQCRHSAGNARNARTRH